MLPCPLCSDLEKKHEDRVRLAFDFAPRELVQSAASNESQQRCRCCVVMLEGIRSWQAQTKSKWSFETDVRRVYARCRGMEGGNSDTLKLEVYFSDDRPKLELEYLSLGISGESEVLYHLYYFIRPR